MASTKNTTKKDNTTKGTSTKSGAKKNNTKGTSKGTSTAKKTVKEEATVEETITKDEPAMEKSIIKDDSVKALNAEHTIQEEKLIENKNEEKKPNEEKIEFVIPKKIDLEEYITVINGFQGKLIYESKRSGELFIWDSFGDEQELTLKELKSAKNSCKSMFINNWFMFDEEFQWVLDYLGVSNFYDNVINIEEFDEVLTSPVEELTEKIEHLSEGQRVSLGFRARQLVADGVIDSIKAIKALEEILSIELIEK